MSKPEKMTREELREHTQRLEEQCLLIVQGLHEVGQILDDVGEMKRARPWLGKIENLATTQNPRSMSVDDGLLGALNELKERAGLPIVWIV
jgi:hypothetical protein